MKKLFAIFCILTLCVTNVQARSHGSFHGHHGGRPSYHFVPHHHHHGGDVAAGLAIGLIGGSILNTVLSQPRVVSTTTYSSSSYVPMVTSPAVVSAPNVISAATVVPTTNPCYSTTNIVTGQTSTYCSSTIITGNPITSQVWISN